MAEVKRERADAEQHRANCAWGLKYLQENRGQHFAHLDEFRERVEETLKVQESKLRKLSIEYDEELYPHLVSSVAERWYLFFLFSSLSVYYFLTRALLYSQVVDQSWSAFGCHGHARVPGGCGSLWEGCGVRHGAWQSSGCGRAS